MTKKYKKIGRNDPCPCGSGKKFKKCCIDKINDKDDEAFLNQPFDEIYKVLRKESKIKQCLHPDKDSCSEKIIGAHSIQNKKILKKISTNGDVYMPCPKPENPFALISKYGRKQATVFTGFCGYHDKTIFQPIEDNLFDKSIEHIFLYTYRCFAIEYHKKQEVVEMNRNLMKYKPSLLKTPIEDNCFRGMQLAIDDFKNEKEIFDNALLSNNYDVLTSVVWEFDQSINFAGTGFEALTRDLENNELQDINDLNKQMKHIFFMVFPEGEKAYCIISWIKEENDIFSNYYEQLNNLTVKERKIYINNMLPIISENIAINPEAWDKLEEYKKNNFYELIFGMDELANMMGIESNRLEKTLFDLFEL